MIPGNFFIGVALLLHAAWRSRSQIARTMLGCLAIFWRKARRLLIFLFGTGLLLWLFVIASALLFTIAVAAFPITIALIIVFFLACLFGKARPGSGGRSGGGQT